MTASWLGNTIHVSFFSFGEIPVQTLYLILKTGYLVITNFNANEIIWKYKSISVNPISGAISLFGYCLRLPMGHWCLVHLLKVIDCSVLLCVIYITVLRFTSLIFCNSQSIVNPILWCIFYLHPGSSHHQELNLSLFAVSHISAYHVQQLPSFLNTRNVVIVTVLTCRFAHSNKCIASELALVGPLSPLCGSYLLVVLYIWSFLSWMLP